MIGKDHKGSMGCINFIGRVDFWLNNGKINQFGIFANYMHAIPGYVMNIEQG